MGRTNKRWSYSAGERGRNRVRVYEDARSASILMEVTEEGQRVRTALGHADRDRAKQEADEAAARFHAAEQLPSNELRVGTLFEMYLGEVTPIKKPHKRKHDQRASRMFSGFFGEDRKVESLSRRDWDRFIAARLRGDLMNGPVRRRAVEYDLRFLLAVVRWATETRGEDGGFLLDVNPLRGLRPPSEPSPKRPLVSAAEYRTLLAVARKVDWRFELALVVAHETGHRIGAIRQLRWSDVDFATARVTWRAETDKQEREQHGPLSSIAVEALRTARRKRPVLGDAWIFPSPGEASLPCSRPSCGTGGDVPRSSRAWPL